MKATTIKKVLIALDYDPTAQKVAETGTLVAKEIGAQVVLLHIVSPDSGYYYQGEYSAIMGFSGFMDVGPIQLDSVNGLKDAALRFLEKSKRHLGDETIQTLVSEGDFADAILKASDDIHADLIVIGSHSRRWLDEILMGSVTEKVLHHTTKPLLIIPTKKRD